MVLNGIRITIYRFVLFFVSNVGHSLLFPYMEEIVVGDLSPLVFYKVVIVYIVLSSLQHFIWVIVTVFQKF